MSEIKGKVPTLQYHARKTYRGHEGQAPRIIRLGSRWSGELPDPAALLPGKKTPR